MKRWGAWIKAGAIFLVVFLLVLSLSLAWLFPSRSVQRWVNTLDVPGETSVSSVRFDPLMRLKLVGVAWRLDKNPFVDSVILKQVILRPLWGKVMTGKKALYTVTSVGGAPIYGALQMVKSRLQLSITTTKGVDFPFPMHLHKGMTLEGTWQLKADLSVDTAKERGGISGSSLFEAKKLHFRWAGSPLGPLNLSFVMGAVGGSIDRSVFDISKIDFRGSDLDVGGAATMWIDPITGCLRLNGTLYFRPKIGLATSNSRLDAAIRLLPKDTRGYRLAF